MWPNLKPAAIAQSSLKIRLPTLCGWFCCFLRCAFSRGPLIHVGTCGPEPRPTQRTILVPLMVESHTRNSGRRTASWRKFARSVRHGLAPAALLPLLVTSQVFAQSTDALNRVGALRTIAGVDPVLSQAILRSGALALDAATGPNRLAVLNDFSVLVTSSKNVRSANDLAALLLQPEALKLSLAHRIPYPKAVLSNGQILWDPMRATVRMDLFATRNSSIGVATADSGSAPAQVRTALDLVVDLAVGSADKQSVEKFIKDSLPSIPSNSTLDVDALRNSIAAAVIGEGSGQVALTVKQLGEVRQIVAKYVGREVDAANQRFPKDKKSSGDVEFPGPSATVQHMRDLSSLLALTASLTKDKGIAAAARDVARFTEGASQIVNAASLIVASTNPMMAVGALMNLNAGFGSLAGSGGNDSAALADIQSSINSLIDLNKRQFQQLNARLDVLDYKMDVVLDELSTINQKLDLLLKGQDKLQRDVEKLGESIDEALSRLDRSQTEIIEAILDTQERPCSAHKRYGTILKPGDAIIADCYSAFIRRLDLADKSAAQVPLSATDRPGRQLRKELFANSEGDLSTKGLSRYLTVYANAIERLPQAGVAQRVDLIPNPQEVLSAAEGYLSFANDYPDGFWFTDKRADLRKFIASMERIEIARQRMLGSTYAQTKNIQVRVAYNYATALEQFEEVIKRIVRDSDLDDLLHGIEMDGHSQSTPQAIGPCNDQVASRTNIEGRTDIGTVTIPSEYWKIQKAATVSALTIPSVYTVTPSLMEWSRLIGQDGKIISALAGGGAAAAPLRVCLSGIGPRDMSSPGSPGREFWLFYSFMGQFTGTSSWKMNYVGEITPNPGFGGRLLAFVDGVPAIKTDFLASIVRHLTEPAEVAKHRAIAAKSARLYPITRSSILAGYLLDRSKLTKQVALELEQSLDELDDALAILKAYLTYSAPVDFATSAELRTLLNSSGSGQLGNSKAAKSWAECASFITKPLLVRGKEVVWDLRKCSVGWNGSSVMNLRRMFALNADSMWSSMKSLRQSEDDSMIHLAVTKARILSLIAEQDKRWGPLVN